MGSTWLKKDIPFHLHVFEYITREVILGWWRSLISVPQDAGKNVTGDEAAISTARRIPN
jgi:hypothetical protein